MQTYIFKLFHKLYKRTQKTVFKKAYYCLKTPCNPVYNGYKLVFI